MVARQHQVRKEPVVAPRQDVLEHKRQSVTLDLLQLQALHAAQEARRGASVGGVPQPKLRGSREGWASRLKVGPLGPADG